MLWTAEKAAAATGGRAVGDWQATGVSIDSRSVASGDVFIALKGPNFDGHRFVDEALAKGAVAAVVADRQVIEAGPERLLEVADTQRALEDLARAARAASAARVIAVTGSVGKTSTKEALRVALAAQGAIHASEGNLNNHWGAPLSLARMPADGAFAVFELGMNHPGELAPLSRMVRPHVALITSVEAVHLEFFDSVAEIADAKAEVFQGLEEGGVAVLNRDNAYFSRLAAAARAAGAKHVIGFGRHDAAQARLIKVALHPDCCCVSADLWGEPATYKISVPGAHSAMNSLAVLACVKAAGGGISPAALALEQMTPLAGRGNRFTVTLDRGDLLVIDESYNASPAAVRAALATLARTPVDRPGRRIAVLGDMLELGAAASEMHAALAGDLVDRGIDLVITAGPYMGRLHDALPDALRGAHAEDAAKLVESVLRTVRAGDVVLVKGSLGSRMAPIVAALRALGDRGTNLAANG